MGTPHEPRVDRETLSAHLDLVHRATREDFDELLTDLLARLYASLAIQNA